MKICAKHWEMMRSAVDDRGMMGLVAKDGEAALDNTIGDLKQEPDPEHKRFDPLMSMHWHWTNNAIKCGGLYLLTQKPDGTEFCPVCEFEVHSKNPFDAKVEIETVADQMLAWCRDQGLLPRPS